MPIQVECCYELGKKPDLWCTRHCPIRRKAKDAAERKWPHLATGYGNAWGLVPETNITAEAMALLELLNEPPEESPMVDVYSNKL